MRGYSGNAFTAILDEPFTTCCHSVESQAKGIWDAWDFLRGWNWEKDFPWTHPQPPWDGMQRKKSQKQFHIIWHIGLGQALWKYISLHYKAWVLPERDSPSCSVWNSWYQFYELYLSIKKKMLSFWLTSLSMTLSRSIHVPANDTISFLFWLSNIPLYVCTTSSLSIALLMDIYMVSMPWLL